MAVVEAEIRDSWTWFLQKLVEAIGSVDEFGWCFISDRQKGLVEAFDIVMPEAHHRYCMRHLYANFKQKGFNSLKLKEEMWYAATSYTKEEFEDHMKNIKEEDPQAYKYLRKIDPNQWTRSYFDPRVKCDLLCNNLSESWNQLIIKARDKPILTMLEMIRRLVMVRIQVRRVKLLQHTGMLCPKPQAKLDKCRESASNCFVLYSGDKQFEVLCFNTFHAVDLEARTCSCRKWDLSGIPCNHAIAAMWNKRLKVEDYADVCYHRETFLKAYEPIMHPLIDMTLWPKIGKEPVYPPVLRTPVGRPRKKRARLNDEAKQPYKLKRMKTSNQCKICHQYGHNQRTCKGDPAGDNGSAKRTTRPVRAQGGRPSTKSAAVNIQCQEIGSNTNSRGGRGGRRGRGGRNGRGMGGDASVVESGSVGGVDAGRGTNGVNRGRGSGGGATRGRGKGVIGRGSAGAGVSRRRGSAGAGVSRGRGSGGAGAGVSRGRGSGGGANRGRGKGVIGRSSGGAGVSRGRGNVGAVVGRGNAGAVKCF